MHTAEYDFYEFENDKHMFSGHSGKQRTKREVATRTNRPDPSGHCRKLLRKMRNTEIKRAKREVKVSRAVDYRGKRPQVVF